MRINCKVSETIIGLIILIVAVWPVLLGLEISNWIIIIASIVLIIHAWTHKHKSNISTETRRSKRRK
ncbi:MAG: hypothetical protein AABX83_04075 [Nanoarchaeota archaeon]